jgi:hypothetical protein
VSSPPVTFRRVVLGFSLGASDRTAVRFAAGFAKLLRLDLLGLFAEDPSLARVAALPALREFRLIERQWRPIEGRNLTSDLEKCAAIARQTFDEIARTTGVVRRFEVVHARMMEAIASASVEGDVVVLVEPRSPAQFAQETFAEAVAAALATPAAVMVVPSPVARERGHILAVSETAEDESVVSAAAIAAAANERLEIVATTDRDAPTLAPRSARGGERMIVMTRRISARLTPLSIMAGRRVPVLVLGMSDGPPPVGTTNE